MKHYENENDNLNSENNFFNDNNVDDFDYNGINNNNNNNITQSPVVNPQTIPPVINPQTIPPVKKSQTPTERPPVGR